MDTMKKQETKDQAATEKGQDVMGEVLHRVTTLERDVQLIGSDLAATPERNVEKTKSEILHSLSQRIQDLLSDAGWHWNNAAAHYREGRRDDGDAERCLAEAIECQSEKLVTRFNLLTWEEDE